MDTSKDRKDKSINSKPNKIGKWAASLVELFDRSVSVFSDDSIHMQDSDNLYPNRIELVERNSVTAFACSNKLKSFLVGKGFMNPALNEKIMNPKKGLRGFDILDLIGNSLKTHKGVYVHVCYDIEGEVNSLDILDFKKCRRAKDDAFGSHGKIFYKDWSVKKSIVKRNKNGKWFYPFTRDKAAIMSQMINDAKLAGVDPTDFDSLVRNYRGQVFFLNLDPHEVYPYAWIHSAYNDADTEYRISLYRNTNYRNGFLNKTILIPNGLDEETRKGFSGLVKSWLGAENSSSVCIITPKEELVDPENVIKVIELKGTYDSKRFELDEKSVPNAIRKAYMGIPRILIEPEDSFFSSSGEAFEAAVDYYNKETLLIREKIAYMFDQFYTDGEDYSIKQLGYEDLQRPGTSTD